MLLPKKKLVWLAEIPRCTAPQSPILSCGRQAFPAAVEAFVSRLTFHQISSPPLWKRKGVIESDLWAAVKLGQLFPSMLEAVREGWDQRDRENKIFDCSPLPNADLIFPLIRILVYEILLATVLH